MDKHENKEPSACASEQVPLSRQAPIDGPEGGRKDEGGRRPEKSSGPAPDKATATEKVLELQIAILARITFLLEKHEPGTLAQWQRRLEAQGRGEGSIFQMSALDQSKVWLYASAILPLRTRFQQDGLDSPRVRRNYRLLVRLIYRGLVRRGDCLPEHGKGAR